MSLKSCQTSFELEDAVFSASKILGLYIAILYVT